MLRTRFTELVGCQVPIQQAPMGAVSGLELVEAVAEAGAFGTLGVAGLPVAGIKQLLAQANDRVAVSYGVNFVVPFIAELAAVEAAAKGARVVDFYHASPSADLIEAVHANGALVCWQVGSVDDAISARDLGVDVIAVRGLEGGGRLHSNRSVWPLLDEILDAVGADVPVLVAGAPATGRGLAAALAAGADGIRVGTRFAASVESKAHTSYKNALLEASATDSVITLAYSADWPEGPRPSRVLRQGIEVAEALGDDFRVTAQFGSEVVDVPLFGSMPPLASSAGDITAMALYAGESVGAITSIQPAAQIVADIAESAEHLLGRFAARSNAGAPARN